jgi:hypothetical protein
MTITETETETETGTSETSDVDVAPLHGDSSAGSEKNVFSLG